MHVQRPSRLPRLVVRERNVVESAEQVAQRHARFQARECGAETKMDAASECDVRVGIARNIESIRVRELRRITIR